MYSLTLGEPDFDTPEAAQQAAINAMRDRDTHYTPNHGIPALREALAQKLLNDNGVRAEADEIIVTAGGSEAVLNIILAILNPGDEVLIPSQLGRTTSLLRTLVRHRCTSRSQKTAIGASISRRIEAHITPKTKMLIVNSPHNPTGLVMTKEEIDQLANIAKKHNLIVLSDEMYEKIISDGTEHVSIASLPGMAERTVTVNGFSKAYAMTGWRIGYLHAPSPLYQGIFRVHQFNTACVPAFTQKAALAAMERAGDVLEYMRHSFALRRTLLADALSNTEQLQVMEAAGAFYLFVRVHHQEANIREFALRLLEDTGVATVPGTAFGDAGEGYLRLSYAASDHVLLEAAKRLVNYVSH
ncbi:LOW QUALITY PROTEIN: aspartate aminotransferase [Geomicrobium sp. JCM 19039]|nr:LOW QUALITY PROTEIN: aspartate aminotransferase [Geomicrobium sp. JCM 19039]